ncbi:DUF7575 domain-containing protein [Natronosalvus rutilus]|uniref:Zinc ribbon domain-containing protein n=1 Tax=Natronosalvus rutilus TaxID=2953753 RepID=A0A9E7NA50_9EURY|nr:zinc ribbon domain-containing protein [Natronosalvus rutilus]UTF53090.1 zinc ribbon domain-containing protein [Natronosalvus rutilus]
MDRSFSKKRPWLAALLGVLVTGFGHCYLRRWRRALGWIVLLFGVSILFVETATLEALAAGEGADLAELSPLLFVAILSVVDAYLLAVAHNQVARRAPAPDGSLTHCPYCGKELDTDLEFCHWCTSDLSDFSNLEAQEETSTESDR